MLDHLWTARVGTGHRSRTGPGQPASSTGRPQFTAHPSLAPVLAASAES